MARAVRLVACLVVVLCVSQAFGAVASPVATVKSVTSVLSSQPDLLVTFATAATAEGPPSQLRALYIQTTKDRFGGKLPTLAEALAKGLTDPFPVVEPGTLAQPIVNVLRADPALKAAWDGGDWATVVGAVPPDELPVGAPILDITRARVWYGGREYAGLAEVTGSGLPKDVTVMSKSDADAAKPKGAAEKDSLPVGFIQVSGGGSRRFLLLAIDGSASLGANAVVAGDDGLVRDAPEAARASKPQVLGRAATVSAWETSGAPLIARKRRCVWVVGGAISKAADEGGESGGESPGSLLVGGALLLNPYISLIGGVTVSDWHGAWGVAVDPRILSRLGLGKLVGE